MYIYICICMSTYVCHMCVIVLLSGNNDDDEDDDDGSIFCVFASSLTLIKVGGNYTTPAANPLVRANAPP